MSSSNTDDIAFIDLAPVDDADSDGIYSKALTYAFENHRIRNVALTGPYGSGKSSIIRTFEKKTEYKFLNISLASFKEEKIGDEKIKLIERSILQQMLYGADANKLPYSRFKRISTPEYPNIKSILFVIWICMAFYFYYDPINPIKDLTRAPISLLWFGELLLSILLLIVPILFVKNIYKSSFNLSLKKLSLKNAEIETGGVSEDSILNRHLDEIIYFFQVTNYRAVVIEDLDRFGDPEIFVRLREVNALINSNKKSSYPVVFLYALKDDMFVHKNRAKFFDFIIPVVPIINSSNSLDMMQKRLEKFQYSTDISPVFLREVSFYIDDLRLIHNIFNEFKMYYEKLNSENINITKLLAMMIYKNVYPSDFEKLHYGAGALFDICRNKDEYIRGQKNQLINEIEDKKRKVSAAKSEKARNIEELIGVYLVKIISYAHANQPLYGLVIDDKHVPLSAIDTFEKFKPIISSSNIEIAKNQQVHRNHRYAIGKSFSHIEEEVNPGETFLSRLDNIRNEDVLDEELNNTLRNIESKIDSIANAPISQLLQNSSIDINSILSENNVEKGRLLVYLVRNGYLDDGYYLYTSNFYEGRLTKNDREYILSIRDFGVYDPVQIIDTPHEVCENIREDDFGNLYALNVSLVDYLLETKSTNSSRLRSVLRYISTNYANSKDFFSSYLISGKHIDVLVVELCNEWPEFVSAAINNAHQSEILSAIVKYVDAETLDKKSNANGVLTKYLSNNGQDILVSGMDVADDYSFLKELNVRFIDLSSLNENADVIRLAIDESLYEININNILYILEMLTHDKNGDVSDISRSNYTAINQYGSKSIIEYIDCNISKYLEDVFLSMLDNDNESEKSIELLINKDIDNDLKKRIIEKENHIFDSYENVPIELWPTLLETKKITATWDNISHAIQEDIGLEALEGFLSQDSVVDTLSEQKISVEGLGEESAKSLSSFVVNADFLATEQYDKLVGRLPYVYHDFPSDVSDEKKSVLCEKRVVRLNDDSFGTASGMTSLSACLIINNIDGYLEEVDKFSIDDPVYEKLVDSELDTRYKIEIIQSLTTDNMGDNASFAKKIVRFLAENEVDLANINQSVIEDAIHKSETIGTSIKLLTKCILLWEKDRVISVISGLSEPYSDIALNGKKPKIPNNKVNLEFAKYLQERDIVSKIKEGEKTIQIITHRNEADKQ